MMEHLFALHVHQDSIMQQQVIQHVHNVQQEVIVQEVHTRQAVVLEHLVDYNKAVVHHAIKEHIMIGQVHQRVQVV